MSKGARLRAQKARFVDPRRVPWSRPRPGEQIETAFIPGLTINNPPAIADMRQKTHDALMEMLGPRRRSGIRWKQVDGRPECERVLRLMYAEDPEDWATVEANLLPFLAEHGEIAVMVVAMCEAAVPR